MSSPASPPSSQPAARPTSESSTATSESQTQLATTQGTHRKAAYKLPKIRTIEDFECDQTKIGEGTYGKVFKAYDKQNGQVVALKQIQITQGDQGLSVTSVREIKLLKSLDHENIVKLKEVVLDSPNKWSQEGEHIYLVFEFMDHDLTGLSGQQGSSFIPGQIRCYAQQMLEGLYVCHKKSILHRDIKGANMLVNNHGILKLADFGLARRVTPDGHHTPNVVTLWYRAPELLLGAKTYDGAIDMWSVGCLLVELYLRQPLFPGTSESDQLSRIYDLCGTPSDDNWPEGRKLPNYRDFAPRQQRRRRLRTKLGGIDEHALDLIDQLLSLDPAKRPTAEKALDHEYFFQLPKLSPSDLPKYSGSFNELFHKSARARETNTRPSEQPHSKKFRDNHGHAQYRTHPRDHHHRLSDNGPRYRGNSNSSGRPYNHHREGNYRSQYRQGSGNPEYVPPRGYNRRNFESQDRTRDRRDDPPPRPLHQREETTHVEPPKDYREQGLTSEGFSKERK